MKLHYAFLSILFLSISATSFSQKIKEINVDNFNQVKFEGSAQWFIIPSNNERVVIESKSEEVFDYIDVYKEGQQLIVSTTEKSKNITKLFRSVTIKVYVSSLNAAFLSGVGSVKMEEKLSSETFTATLRGTGNMHLNLECDSFGGHVYGTGGLNIIGSAKSLVVTVEGVGSFNGYEFEALDVDATVSGVGGAKVYASQTLTATINGVGSIRYKGDPVNKNFSSNGVGTIKKAN
ncbi:MAG: DUF2807 domain-containing protein [Bacteroidales bacterium]|jgi:hypothetical protein|nr:hypothetical protein [Lentimicrobiaceae bacterium]MDG1136112.1 DUF2807 domain-containing protein [Bacteroidales bacterium]MDG1902057.1 DUF2807 domain-containing protein [Bacteroidales bacterium]MDG2081497.1 DUF2807 domain-containing protein [Bacteroidales bacterium]|tara:strand:+ start:13137 stop:13838 length:702 start_codon:yes stop_codon:yes gene_type:complete